MHILDDEREVCDIVGFFPEFKVLYGFYFSILFKVFAINMS